MLFVIPPCNPCSSVAAVDLLLLHFFINSSTAAVIALTPVRIVGSGKGAKSAECSDGSGVPVSLLSLTFGGSTAPSQKIVVGIWWPSSEYLAKSSLAIICGVAITFSSPSAFTKAAARRAVKAGSLYIEGVYSVGLKATIGTR